MKVKFWGVRGSIPTPPSSKQIIDKFRNLLKKIYFDEITDPIQLEIFINNLSAIDAGIIGGNTSCIELEADKKLFIFDMGSGLRNLGNHIIKQENDDAYKEFFIFLSHTHWDHIMGLPFFTPAFFPNNQLHFYSPHPNLQERLEIQQDFRFFPVSLDQMSSKKKFNQLEPNQEITIGKVKIQNIPLHHPGGSFGYRLEHRDKIFIYATDTEIKTLEDSSFKESKNFFQNADLLIFDAQYTFEEAFRKEDWGHSSAMVGIDLAIETGVKKMALFHHDPERNDSQIKDILKKSINYKNINYPNSNLEIILALEDLEIKL